MGSTRWQVLSCYISGVVDKYEDRCNFRILPESGTAYELKGYGQDLHNDLIDLMHLLEKKGLITVRGELTNREKKELSKGDF